METTKIAVFQSKQIRKTLHNNEWWFSVTDVVEALTDSERPRKYWNDLKIKLTQEGYVEVSEKIGQLKLPAQDGKQYLTDCANTETLFRIIQTIPSPKAEPFIRKIVTSDHPVVFVRYSAKVLPPVNFENRKVIDTKVAHFSKLFDDNQSGYNRVFGFE